MTRHKIALAAIALLLAPLTAAAELPKDVQQGLETAKYVYISSMRKDGAWSAPAEIWFMWHDGAVYVGTRPTSWRVKRIKAGRPQAKIAVGKPDGPSFTAVGALIQDAKIEALLLESLAKKYPDRWADHAENFRNGFKDGSRVIVRYAPKS
jgi:hypothetical protein